MSFPRKRSALISTAVQTLSQQGSIERISWDFEKSDRHPDINYMQGDAAREERLQKAQKEMSVRGDDDRGDKQVFNALHMEKERREEHERARLEKLKALEPSGPEKTSADPSTSEVRPQTSRLTDPAL